MWIISHGEWLFSVEWICSVWRPRLEWSWREERQQVRSPEPSSARAGQYWVTSLFAAMFTGLVPLEVVRRYGKIMLLATWDIHISILLYYNDWLCTANKKSSLEVIRKCISQETKKGDNISQSHFFTSTEHSCREIKREREGRGIIG